MPGNSSGHHSGPSRWPRLWPALLAVLALAPGNLAGPGTASAQQYITCPFSPIGGSRVTGYAAIAAEDQGTNIRIFLAGLGSNAPSEATLNSGTCAQPGTSALWVLNLRVDERGRAEGNGTVAAGGRGMVLTDIFG